MNFIQECQNLIAERVILQNNKKTIQRKVEDKEEELAATEMARAIFIKAEEISKTQVVDRLVPPITAMLRSIYGRPFEFILDFKPKKNGFMIIPKIMEGSFTYHNPIRQLGGGVMDVVSFALQVLMWKIDMRNDTMPIFIMDEPFKFLGRGELAQRGAKAIHEMTRMAQFIIVTHMDEFFAEADASWEVTHNGIYSTVEER